ncbi:phosphatidylserine decarboxylase family protein [Gemmatimonadota bacterium]
MRIVREGWAFVLPTFVLCLAAWMAVLLTDVTGMVIVAAVLTLLLLFVLFFFRDPEPTATNDPSMVMAPGQGRVVDIAQIEEPTFFGGPARKISIFLSVFDVHVQRAPVTGQVEHRSYHPGGYAVAWKPKASEENEQAALGFATPHGRVLVRQIAGLVARRIVTYPVEGSQVEIGERIGLIRFGSRVDLFIPLEWEVTCKRGDRVRVGRTPIARISEAPQSQGIT